MHLIARSKFFATSVLKGAIELDSAFVDDVLGLSSRGGHACGLQKLQQINVFCVDMKDLRFHGGRVQRSEGYASGSTSRSML